MLLFVCDGSVSVGASGEVLCTGTLSTVEYEPALPGLTTEDAQDLTYATLGLFAVVFGILALKKALQ